MTSHLSQLVEFVALHALLAYVVIFLAALLEAVPVLGALVPGSTVILALSALVPSGNLQLAPVLIAAILGAMLGDGAAFWTGHRAKRSVLTAWPLAAYPALLTRSKMFFRRHGTLAVFLARFVPPVRAFVPITAGALGMKPARFYSVNSLAALFWAPAMVLPGMLAGSLAERWGMGVRSYGWPLVAGLLIIGTGAWAIQSWRKSRRLASDNPSD